MQRGETIANPLSESCGSGWYLSMTYSGWHPFIISADFGSFTLPPLHRVHISTAGWVGGGGEEKYAREGQQSERSMKKTCSIHYVNCPSLDPIPAWFVQGTESESSKCLEPGNLMQEGYLYFLDTSFQTDWMKRNQDHLLVFASHGVSAFTNTTILI